ncbi:sugar ABC transporter permease [Fastidiosipila sanguinis]
MSKRKDTNKNRPYSRSAPYMSKRKDAKKNRLYSRSTPYLFLLPWFIGLILFTAGPLLMSLIMSFFNWPVIGSPEFVGLNNYVTMFTQDPQFWSSLKITMLFTVIFVPLKLVLALVLALIISKNIKGATAFRVAFYLPTVISSVAVSIIFDWMLNSEFGIINYLLSLIGIKGPDWLNNPSSAFAALIMASIWSVGSLMLVFYTALKGVPIDVYEAATIDGASEMRQFFSITLPLITPTILFNTVTSIITTLQSLDLVMLLTKGGPLRSTHMYGLFVYNNAFDKHKLGYAAANAWVMFIIIMILTALVFKSSDFWVYTKKKGGKK